MRAHPQAQNVLIGAPLTAIHLTAGALWLGSLIYVLRLGIAWRRSPDSVRQVVLRYSRLAAWLLITALITGLTTGLMLIPFDEVITTDYGRALLLKVGVAVMAAGLAFIARVHLRRGAPMDRVRRPARLEAGALLAVLGLSATLTVLPMPGTADAALDFPPPATGPVAPATGLAGEVGFFARASEGQLVVQLEAPELDDFGPRQEADFRLSGVLSNEQESNTEIKFRRCGTGCFFSAVEWKRGSNQLTLWPEAENWTSTRATISVEWPVVRAGSDALLSRAVSTTAAAGELTLYEQVTSNTASPTEPPSRFETTGAAHVDRSPFASGTAPVVATHSDDEEGNRRLILSYPGENVTVELVLAANDRIIREVLTDPHHSIRRTLVYGH